MHNLIDASRDERGFTLVELLVVILIIGILAGIALPTYLGQREKGQDTEAKENATNLIRQVQSCFIDSQDYTECNNADLADTGLPLGSTDGFVEAVNPAQNELLIIAHSRSGGKFKVEAGPGHVGVERNCTGGTSGCKANGHW